MASESVISDFKTSAVAFRSFDMTKVYREGLGQVSLTQVKEITNDLAKKIEMAYSLKELMPDQFLSQFLQNINQYLQVARTITTLNDTIFVGERTQRLADLSTQAEAIRTIWPFFVTVAVEKSGLLSSSASLTEDLRSAAAKSLEEFKVETEKLVAAQKQQIDELTSRVRKTAANISVAQAQSQFESASHTLWNKAKAWGVGSIISFAGFVVFAVYLMHHPPASLLGTQLQQTARAVKETSGSETQVPISLVVAQTAYLTAIRITLLTALGALTTFCLRMMRSSIHMAEYNDHRRRIANSISSFVEAAGTPEQRDAILLRLVDSVVQFGESGLLENEKDSVSAPTIAFEAITKNFAPSK